MELTIRGVGVSPGIAIGPVFLLGPRRLDVPKFEVDDAAAELERFEKAVEKVRDDLVQIKEQTENGLGAKHAEIFLAHLSVLNDTAWDEVVDRIKTERQNAEYIVEQFINRYKKQMEAIDDPFFRSRLDITLDVGNRIVEELLESKSAELDGLNQPSVIVAHDLSPAETAKLDLNFSLGIATDVSGPTSHTAILARALEIPAVVSLKHIGSYVKPGDVVIIDGSTGNVVIRPNPDTIAEFEAERERQEARRERLERQEHAGPAATADGKHIPTYANIEIHAEVPPALRHRAEGIGLYRTEYIYMSVDGWPTEEEQYEAYSEVTDALNPAPVTLRTLDIGGDKLMSHLPGYKEPNPQLGWRAVRFCIERPDIFKAQLRAMLRASVHGNVQIMFPMISGVAELREVKRMYREVQEDLTIREVPFNPNVKVGSMIEIPSAVIMADALAQECDFFSIGSNDLVQFALGIDRQNDRVANLYEPAHPAVLRMIRDAAAAAQRHGIPCGICGEMAADPVFTETLIGLGVTSLSMAPVALPVVRDAIARISLTEATKFANRLVAMSCTEEILDAIQERNRILWSHNPSTAQPEIAPAVTGVSAES